MEDSFWGKFCHARDRLPPPPRLPKQGQGVPIPGEESG